MLSEQETSRRETTRGVLLGAACGDAVGAPFEGETSVPRSLVENWLASSGPMRYTDDTAMTLVVARHLLATSGSVDEDRLAGDFAHEWQSEPHRGYGAAPPKIFRAVLAGEDWTTAARSAFGGAGSWGNGGAMRVAPVAVLPVPIADRVRLARRQASVTHAHPLAQDGAVLQCAVIAEAATSTGDPVDPEAFLAAVSAHVTTREFHDALQDIKEVLQGGLSAGEIAARLGSDVTALGSVPTAASLFLASPDDMETALVSAVRVGGDTDTVASMVGAAVGARLGERGLPQSLARRLERVDEIRELADQLASLTAR